MLGGLLGGKASGALSALTGSGAGGAGGAGGLMGMLDADGDGNALDDIMKMMGKGRG
jgi:hypothetical protein